MFTRRDQIYKRTIICIYYLLSMMQVVSFSVYISYIYIRRLENIFLLNIYIHIYTISWQLKIYLVLVKVFVDVMIFIDSWFFRAQSISLFQNQKISLIWNIIHYLKYFTVKTFFCLHGIGCELIYILFPLLLNCSCIIQVIQNA